MFKWQERALIHVCRLDAPLDYNAVIPSLLIHRHFGGGTNPDTINRINRILKLFVGKFTYWLTLRRLRGVPVLILYLTKQEIENTEEIENTVVKVGPSFPWNYWLLFSEQKYHLRCHLKSPHWWAQNDIDMTIVDIWILRWTDSGSGHYCYQQTWKLSQSFQTTTSWLNVSSL